MTKPRPEVVLSDEEWRKRLGPEQFRVTRERGTERQFSESYDEVERQGSGTYFCIACSAELFTSNEKFNSGCGWPSFYDSSKARNIGERADLSLGSRRTEVFCRRCDAHLGHVFDHEGFGTPTDRRFCINAAALKFIPRGGPAPPLLEPTSEEAKKEDCP